VVWVVTVSTDHHNHLSHHILAAYSLGASPSHLQSIFDADLPGMAALERSKADGGEEVLKSPPLVHEGNWWDAKMLGDIRWVLERGVRDDH
jgi:hypothetical protein